MMMETNLVKIFYSWQSDSESKYNRGFIKNVLKKVINEINKDIEFCEAGRELLLDHDTKDVPGTPDLAGTIFEKISSATLFIADISFIAKNSANNRKVSNPNVLIELGYAIARLGSDRVLCVLNTANGLVEDLPFDLKHKRQPIQYCLNKNSKDKDKQKLQVITDLKLAITTILKFQEFKSTHQDFLDHPSREHVFNAIMASDSSDDWSKGCFDDISRTETMFFKKNVNLRFVYAYDERFIQQADFKEDWANMHRNPNATGYFVQLYFASTHILNVILVSVDGGQALLPIPKCDENRFVSLLDYKVAQIFDKTGLLDEYMTRSGLQISDSVS